MIAQATHTDPRPTSAAEAVLRARRIANVGGQYVLGTGDYRPVTLAGIVRDVPWTTNQDGTGSDCAGFVVWCYKLQRHRVGFNHGDWSSVADDLNCNSMLEDAQHTADLFELVVGRPIPGDMLVYPTFSLTLADGSVKRFIGHICIVVDNKRAPEDWDADHPPYHMLDVAQCKGPNYRAPGVVLTDGSIWSHHDATWPKAQHRSYVIRAVNLNTPTGNATFRVQDP